MGVNLLIIGPFPEPITGNSLANKVVLEGFIKKKHYRVSKINTSLSFFDENVGKFSFLKFFQSLKYNLKLYKVFLSDIVYITPGQTFFGVLKYSGFIFTSKLLGKKIVIHIHGNHLKTTFKDSSKFKRKILKLILGCSSEGIVLSESLKNNLTPFLLEEKIKVVYNFVESYLVKDIEEDVKNKEFKELRIVYLSNLMKEKGILDLLTALEILEQNNIGYQARIAGNIDAINKVEVKELLDRLKYTKYEGVLRGEEKKKMLLWANTFVFPSYYKMEGQPLSILEAMSTGNLILTTNHAGISDIFEDKKNGFYIEKNDPQGIVDTLSGLINNESLMREIGCLNYEYAKNKYSCEEFIENIDVVFNFN